MSRASWTKLGLSLATSGLWVFLGTPVPAATVNTITNLPAAQPKAAAVHKVSRTTQMVRSFDGRTLQLKNGKKYDLQGVQVTDLSGKGKGLRSAEMTFVDNRLKEIVIRMTRPTKN
jgi:hypothetical protein